MCSMIIYNNNNYSASLSPSPRLARSSENPTHPRDIREFNSGMMSIVRLHALASISVAFASACATAPCKSAPRRRVPEFQ